MRKTCELCGNNFETTNKKKRFCSNDCVKKKMSDSKKSLWENEDYRNKMSEQSKYLWTNLDYIKKTIDAIVLTQDDAYKMKLSEKATERWKDSIFKDKMMLHFNSDKNKKDISDRFKKLWQNEDFINSVKDNGKLYKKYILPSGEIVNIQGNENLALDILLKNYSENDLIIGISEINKIDSFYYEDKDGETHRYFPDFYIKSENKIIEVKSEWTYNINYEKNQLKMNACLEKNYNFEFMIID